ncbi:hypothetical protein J7K50_02430 [bacterium]|nr:hypothetical protein [bacterium]
MKVPMNLTSTVLRYKLDPGELGTLKSATPSQSMPSVTGQELGNLRQFTREAASRGDDVLLAKIEYKTDLVDGKLSIKAGRTTVYSVPSARAAQIRYDRDSHMNEQRDTGFSRDTAERIPSSGGAENGAARIDLANNNCAAATDGSRASGGSEDYEETAGDKAVNDQDSPEVRRRTREKLENERTALEGRLDRSEEKSSVDRAERRERGDRISVEGETRGERVYLEKRIEELNREIGRIESMKVADANARLIEVAKENADAQVSAVRSRGGISLASGRINAMM